LDAIQSLITKYNEQLNDYDNLAKSIFNEMFGDVVSNDKGWERKKLSEMCSEVTSSKRIFAKEYVKTGIPFYRSKEVIERSKGLEPSTELFISTERYNEIKNQYGIPRKNDLLISAVGTIGDIWVVNIEKPFYFKDGNLIWIKTNSLTNSIYLKYLLRILIAEYKKSMPNGAAYSALTINKLQNLVVYNIPLSLQQTFAARIEAIEKQKEQIKQQITDLQTLFDSRMQYYFD
jgi:type I restriction enzyme S subunit